MPSTTSFSDRIAKIEARAAQGDNIGFVTPGVVDDSTAKTKAPKPRKNSKDRGSYLGTLMGGLFATVSIVAVGLAFAVSDVDTGGIDEIATILLGGSD